MTCLPGFETNLRLVRCPSSLALRHWDSDDLMVIELCGETLAFRSAKSQLQLLGL